MASKKNHATRQDRERAVRRRAGFDPRSTVRAAIERGRRRELKRILFGGRERAPCCFCRRELAFQEATLEHIRPRSRGGSTEIENLAISCSPCNSARGDMGYEKFRGRRS